MTSIDERIWRRLTPFIGDAIARQPAATRDALEVLIESYDMGGRWLELDGARHLEVTVHGQPLAVVKAALVGIHRREDGTEFYRADPLLDRDLVDDELDLAADLLSELFPDTSLSIEERADVLEELSEASGISFIPDDDAGGITDPESG